MREYLIGLPLCEAERILGEEKIKCYITKISGGKDEEILSEPYVVCVREQDNKIFLIVTEFKTTI